MIKLYAWIDLFSGKIDTKRKEELNTNFWRINNMALMVVSMQFFPQLLQLACFSVYIGTGNSMDLPLAYTIISLFGILNGPIRALPWFFGQFIEFVIAMKRIQKFLVCQEINESVVKKTMD